MSIFRKKSTVDRKTLAEVIEFLETAPPVEYEPRSVCPDIVARGLGLLETDYDYLAHYEKMEEEGVEPEQMTLGQIGTMLTFFTRGERFCDGFTVDEINSGRMLRVFRRLDELTK